MAKNECKDIGERITKGKKGEDMKEKRDEKVKEIKVKKKAEAIKEFKNKK